MAQSISLVPLRPGVQQSLSLDTGAGTYIFRLVFADIEEGGWLIDISGEDGSPIACGLPLLPKRNILAQHTYLGLGFALFIVNAADPDGAPAFSELGESTKLYLLRYV